MAEALRSIGQVLATLKADFPDISISKIRFLESEGLLSPERAPSGYRRYAQNDVDRLRYILGMQKHHYLPLKVIREHLDLIDQGLEPPALETPRPTTPVEAAAEAAQPRPAVVDNHGTPPRPPRRPMRLSRRELLELSGLPEPTLVELERHGVVAPRRGTVYYGRDALTVAVAARRLAVYGMDARHLRAFKQAADREVGLVEQALAPHLRRSLSSRETTAEVIQLVIHAHAALIRSAMDR